MTGLSGLITNNMLHAFHLSNKVSSFSFIYQIIIVWKFYRILNNAIAIMILIRKNILNIDIFNRIYQNNKNFMKPYIDR